MSSVASSSGPFTKETKKRKKREEESEDEKESQSELESETKTKTKVKKDSSKKSKKKKSKRDSDTSKKTKKHKPIQCDSCGKKTVFYNNPFTVDCRECLMEMHGNMFGCLECLPSGYCVDQEYAHKAVVECGKHIFKDNPNFDGQEYRVVRQCTKCKLNILVGTHHGDNPFQCRSPSHKVPGACLVCHEQDGAKCRCNVNYLQNSEFKTMPDMIATMMDETNPGLLKETIKRLQEKLDNQTTFDDDEYDAGEEDFEVWVGSKVNKGVPPLTLLTQ